MGGGGASIYTPHKVHSSFRGALGWELGGVDGGRVGTSRGANDTLGLRAVM